MVFTDDIVCALLGVGRQVAVGEVIARPSSGDRRLRCIQNREREARKPAHGDLVGS